MVTSVDFIYPGEIFNCQGPTIVESTIYEKAKVTIEHGWLRVRGKVKSGVLIQYKESENAKTEGADSLGFFKPNAPSLIFEQTARAILLL